MYHRYFDLYFTTATIPEPYTLSEVQFDLLSFTAHEFKKLLRAKHPQVLKKFKVDLADREYQFWERNPLSIAIYHDAVFYQKAKYVHWNPCTEKWRLAERPEAYKYSSAYKSDEGSYWALIPPFVVGGDANNGPGVTRYWKDRTPTAAKNIGFQEWNTSAYIFSFRSNCRVFSYYS